MKYWILALWLLSPLAMAKDHIPKSCNSPLMMFQAKLNIPYLLGNPPAKIVKIKALSDSSRVGPPGDESIVCPLRVWWSNGHVDIVGVFREQMNAYGQVMVSYQP